MAGINQGRPETAIGEPIRFGDDLDFEIEQHPISDRLIIRDTANGKEAYVRADRGGSIGGDGVLIKALKEGKPVADDGRTHDTIQQAERAASSFVFVPPGTFNEIVNIKTRGLTLRGSGDSTRINSPSGKSAIFSPDTDNVTIDSVSAKTSDNKTIVASGKNSFVQNCLVKGGQNRFVGIEATNIINCRVESTGNERGAFSPALTGDVVVGCIASDNVSDGIEGLMLANNIVSNCRRNLVTFTDDSIIIGNRSIGATSRGIEVQGGTNSIVANNRVSDSTDSDIQNVGTGTLLDGNLTRPSN